MLKNLVSGFVVLSILFTHNISSAQVILLINSPSADAPWVMSKCKEIHDQLGQKLLCMWQPEFEKIRNTFITSDKFIKTVDYYETDAFNGLMRVTVNTENIEKVETNWGQVSSSGADIAMLVKQVVEQAEIESQMYMMKNKSKGRDFSIRSSPLNLKSIATVNLDKKTKVGFDIDFNKDNQDQFKLSGDRETNIVYSLNFSYKY